MAKKLKAGAGRKAAGAGKESAVAQALAEGNLAKAVRDSAQEIWLAGLGAYTRAKDEGSGAFETLVKMGMEVQAKSREVAGSTREALASRASGTWGKVEQVFEERVSRSLSALGVPSAKDFAELNERIAALNDSVQKLLREERRAIADGAQAATTRARKAVKELQEAAAPVAEEVAKQVGRTAARMTGGVGRARKAAAEVAEAPAKGAPKARKRAARAKPADAAQDPDSKE